MNDCAHAAGHGYFYYFFDIGRSVLACTDPTLASHAPGPEFSWDADAKSAGLDGINYMSESPALYVALSTARADSTNLSEQGVCGHRGATLSRPHSEWYFDSC
jgi:hypothetical protein